jgi:dUTP pyrophosphatase
MEVKFQKRNDDAIIPTRAEEGSSGYDIYALYDTFIPVGHTVTVSTGIALELPRFELYPLVPMIPMFKIEDRSGLASKGLRTGAGVVDYSYRGEIRVVLHNLTCQLHTCPVLHRKGYQVRKGDRIAQGVIIPTIIPPSVEVVSLSKTDRGDGGFGSTGN